MYKYFEKTKTFVQVIFDYRESTRNVYKTFQVFINGKKSNIRGLQNHISTTPPQILTANTYFWTPSANAGGRRRNEERRNNEVYDYFIGTEGFSTEDTFYLDDKKLAAGEKFGIDADLGFFLEYRKEKYHFGFGKRHNFDIARKAIKERRIINLLTQQNQKTRNSMMSSVFVTIQDSIDAGNCPAGTQNFYDSLPLVKKGFHIKAVKATALLSIRNDRFTNRAVTKAIQRTAKQTA